MLSGPMRYPVSTDPTLPFGGPADGYRHYESITISSHIAAVYLFWKSMMLVAGHNRQRIPQLKLLF